MADVDLEEVAQRRTRGAHAERGEGRVDIEGDKLRISAHVVGPWRLIGAGQGRLRPTWLVSGISGLSLLWRFDLVRVERKLQEAGPPHVRGHAPVFVSIRVRIPR